MEKTTTLDEGYVSGMLSVYHEALDDKETLYEATNDAKIILKQTLTYNGKKIVVESTSLFPDTGILRIGPDIGLPGDYEMVYYGKKTNNTFEELIRGFAGSRQSIWSSNKSYVSNSVFAEHHNAIKDAIINIQTNLGTKNFPAVDSLNHILKNQEVKFLAPKPIFRAFPIKGVPSLKVRFQNFSTGHIVRYLWDFGDGGTSLEKSPIHTYIQEGFYTVTLNIITSTGAQGIATKVSYIEVNNDESLPFFYVDSETNPYSVATASELVVDPKEFIFVDQTDGDVVQRNWVFGDGENYTEQDPDLHEISHIYQDPGEYVVSEIIQFANGRIKIATLPEPLVVL